MIPNDLIVIFIEWKKNVIDVKSGQQSSSYFIACSLMVRRSLIELYDKLIVIPYKMIGNGIMSTYIGLSVEFRGPAWPFKKGRNYFI